MKSQGGSLFACHAIGAFFACCAPSFWHFLHAFENLPWAWWATCHLVSGPTWFIQSHIWMDDWCSLYAAIVPYTTSPLKNWSLFNMTQNISKNRLSIVFNFSIYPPKLESFRHTSLSSNMFFSLHSPFLSLLLYFRAPLHLEAGPIWWSKFLIPKRHD